jgi:3-deoxy-D-manno-octulosonic-acid transferase
VRFPVSAGRILVTLLGKTWRVRRMRSSAGISAGRVLYGFWHGVQLPLLFTHRSRGITVMVSRSRDGAIIADLLQSMGFSTVRGSSSRGGARAASELIDALSRGDGAITPDGPRGPRETAKPGITAIASLAGVPVVAMGVAAWPAVRLGSWDRFMIPLPGSRVAVAEGIPIPPGRMTPAAVDAEMRRTAAAASLAVRPGAAVQAGIAGMLGAAACPLLLLRPGEERRERLGICTPRDFRPAWLHGSSLGELRGLLPVAERLGGMGVPVYFTCFTPSGREFIRREGLQGGFLPLDAPGCVRRFLSGLDPRLLILAETEIWPVLLRETILRGIPSGMVNARLSRRSVRGYSLIRRYVADIISGFAGVLCRTREDASAFQGLGVDPRILSVAGDGKALVKPGAPDPSWRGMLVPGLRYVVAGSTRESEEEFVLKAARLAGMGVVLAPRHPERLRDVLGTADRLGWRTSLWSEKQGPSECILIDVHGVLPRVYPLGDAAFLGGTVAPVGGHNILEPLAGGLPVLVGPHHGNHAATVEEGVRLGVVEVVSDPEDAADTLSKWSHVPGMDERARQLARRGEELFDSRLSVLLEGLLA